MSDDSNTFIHLAPSEKEKNIPEYQQDLPCPNCGSAPETGFGLAGGGYGIYSFCPKCGDILTKSETPD